MKKYIKLHNIFVITLFLMLVSCEKDSTNLVDDNVTGIPRILNGLMLYISFDNEIKDNSNNKYNLQIENVFLGIDKNGRTNKCGVFFDKQRNNIQILNLPSDIKSYSMSMWILPVYNYGIPYNNQIHIAGRYGRFGNSSLKFSLVDDYINCEHFNDNNYLVNSYFKMPHTIWSHITFTYEETSKNLKIYLNGKIIYNDIFYTVPGIATDPFAIGMDVMNNNRVFNGSIDEFYLFNRALSDNEVSVLYGK